MNIMEATIKALDCGGYMTRTGAWWHNHSFIKPTNSKTDCYQLYSACKTRHSPRWNPTTEDVMADDWEVHRLKP